MTQEENEEFNRIEMESRIKQEYVRAMRKTTREEKISRPAVHEVPANNRMIASHQDHVRRLIDELAIARIAVRELGDRLARIEAGNMRNDVIEEVAKEIEKFTAFGIDTVQSFAVYIRGMKT